MLINAAPDPNVTASAANEFETIVLTARVPGPAGEGIAISQSVTNRNRWRHGNDHRLQRHDLLR